MLFIGSNKLSAVDQITLLFVDDEDDAISIDDPRVCWMIINLQKLFFRTAADILFLLISTNQNDSSKCLYRG